MGALLGARLSAAGHAVCFWVRPERRSASAGLTVERVTERRRQRQVHNISVPFLSQADELPSSDWLLVCVRGEQLETALQQVVERLGPTQNIMISSVSHNSVVARARTHGLRGIVLAHHVSFGVWRDPADPTHYFWFPFAPPSLVSAEAERGNLHHARELALALNRGGLRSHAVLTARGPMQGMMALSAPFLAGWDLCDFQLGRLARDAQLRHLTARAMVEACHSQPFSGAARLLRLMPQLFWSALLRLLPWLIGANGREVWVHHGPKIREQTRYSLALLLASNARSPALHALHERLTTKPS